MAIKNINVNGNSIAFGGGDGNSIIFDANQSYDDGTVGKELQKLTSCIDISNGNLSDEEICITSDDISETYVKINKDGIYTKNIFDLDGNAIIQSQQTVNQTINVCDSEYFYFESKWWITDDYLDEKYSQQEQTYINNFINTFSNRSGFKIAIISDTHGSGAYSYNDQRLTNMSPSTCLRSISAFNQIANKCNAAIHGGDISCDYGTSRNRILQYSMNVVKRFRFKVPFFITKGNHDENENRYVEVNPLDVNWNNGKYYVRNFSTFSVIEESQWRGEDLYIEKQEIVSDKEFKNVIQHWLCPQNAVWGEGAYYYYDFENQKLRMIVANSFPIKNDYSNGDVEEYVWLASEALNFSSKDNPQEWSAIMVRHTQSTSITDLSNCINAFINGSIWTYKSKIYNFGEMNGGGLSFIAHIHGHEHGNVYSNGAGYFDIGETCAYVNIKSLGNASTYGLSVWTVDLQNKLIHEDTINGHYYIYDYENNVCIINVGEIIHMAESGLSRTVVFTSSDETIATCTGGNEGGNSIGATVTAINIGDVVITATSSKGQTRQYNIKIV